MKNIISGAFTIALVYMLVSPALSAQSIENIEIVKISSKDGMAVIKAENNKLKIVKIGDQLCDDGRITDISDNRIVVEQYSDNNMETIIISTENSKQEVVRIKKIDNDKPVLYTPQVSK